MGNFLGIIGWHAAASQPRALSDVPARLLAPRQVIALRQGWSDAAVGHEHRTLAVSLRISYERGFRGGTVFSARRRAA